MEGTKKFILRATGGVLILGGTVAAGAGALKEMAQSSSTGEPLKDLAVSFLGLLLIGTGLYVNHRGNRRVKPMGQEFEEALHTIGGDINADFGGTPDTK